MLLDLQCSESFNCYLSHTDIQSLGCWTWFMTKNKALVEMRISLSSFSVRCYICFWGFNSWWGNFSPVQIISCAGVCHTDIKSPAWMFVHITDLFPECGEHFFPFQMCSFFWERGAFLTCPDFLPWSVYPCCRRWPQFLHFVQVGGSAGVPGKFPIQVSDDLNASHGYIDTLLSNYILLWQSSVE